MSCCNNIEGRLKETQFRKSLYEAIEYRKLVLDPKHPFLRLPITVKDEDKIRMELDLLENIYTEYCDLYSEEGN